MDTKEFKNVIEDIIDTKITRQGITKFVSAIVNKLNDDGSVDVYLPPDTKRIISNVLNKTGESLQIGDSVELSAKNGKTNNSWVAVKHGTNFDVDKKISEEITKEIESLKLGNVSQLNYTVVDTW